MPAHLRPMSQFDPDRPAILHEKAGDRTFDWSPEWASHYRIFSRRFGDGMIFWDGLLLDGWRPMLRMVK